MVSYIITDTTVTVVIDGDSMPVPRRSAQGKALLEELGRPSPDPAAVRAICDPAQYLSTVSGGQLSFRDGQVTYKGDSLPKVLGARVRSLLNDGVPVQYLINFYENLLKNPSKRAVQELYTFLEHKNLPITSDGMLVAYKAITSEWKDKHTETVDNHIGCKPRMPRNAVCDDADVGCSTGYHAGSLEYVKDFANDNDRIVIVKLSPCDVVSIPKDCSCQKLRTCAYEVVDQFRGPIRSSGIEDAGDAYREDRDLWSLDGVELGADWQLLIS